MRLSRLIAGLERISTKLLRSKKRRIHIVPIVHPDENGKVFLSMDQISLILGEFLREREIVKHSSYFRPVVENDTFIGIDVSPWSCVP